MSHPDQLEVVHPNGQVQFFDLDPAIGILNIGRHPDNDVVLDGPDVRSFHALIDHRQFPYRLIPLSDPASHEEPIELSPWQTIPIGDFELILVSSNGRDGSRASAPVSAAALRTPAAHAQHQRSSPDHAGQPQWHLAPGQTLTHTLTIDNSGGRPATFYVDVGGVDPSWLSLSQQDVRLDPGQQATIQMSVRVPPDGTARGTLPLTWQIWSPEYPEWQQQTTVQLVVAGTQGVAMGALSPDPIRNKPFRRMGEATLPLTNHGGEPVAFELSGRDLRRSCRVKFTAPGSVVTQLNTTLVEIPPQQTVPVRVVVVPDDLRLLGAQTQRHRISVRGHVWGSNAQEQNVTGTFYSRPIINVGPVLLVLFILLLAGLFVYWDEVGGWVDQLLYPSSASEALALERLAAYQQSHQQESARFVQARSASAVGGPAGTTVDPAEVSYEQMFREIGRRYNVDWRMLASLAYRESLLDPEAQGDAGEYGLMQVLPSTWNEWAPLVEADDPWNPYHNILVGSAYLSFIHSYFTDLGYPEYQWALAAYNWGPERVLQILDRRGSWEEIPLPQRRYVGDILLGMEQAPQRVQAADQSGQQ